MRDVRGEVPIIFADIGDTAPPTVANFDEGYELAFEQTAGKKPTREGTNKIYQQLYAMGRDISQFGGSLPYSLTIDFLVDGIVTEAGVLYICLLANGPSTATKVPGVAGSETFWKEAGPTPIVPDAPGLVLLDKQSIVTQSSVDFVTGIDSTFDKYLIVGSKVLVSIDGVNLWSRISTDGGSTFKSGGSDYRYGVQAKPDNGSAVDTGNTAAAQMLLTQSTLGLGNLATELQNFDLTFYGPSEASPTSFGFVGSVTGDSAETIQNIMSGRYIPATAVNAVQVLPSSGNISGEFALYGFNITP